MLANAGSSTCCSQQSLTRKSILKQIATAFAALELEYGNTAGEISQAGLTHSEAEFIFSALDTDGDGGISRAEVEYNLTQLLEISTKHHDMVSALLRASNAKSFTFKEFIHSLVNAEECAGHHYRELLPVLGQSTDAVFSEDMEAFPEERALRWRYDAKQQIWKYDQIYVKVLEPLGSGAMRECWRMRYVVGARTHVPSWAASPCAVMKKYMDAKHQHKDVHKADVQMQMECKQYARMFNCECAHLMCCSLKVLVQCVQMFPSRLTCFRLSLLKWYDRPFACLTSAHRTH